MADLAKLKNIGKVSEQWLNEARILTEDDLRAIGAVEAWRRIKVLYPDRVTLLGLYALEAALMGIHWNVLPEEIKQELREQAEMAQ